MHSCLFLLNRTNRKTREKVELKKSEGNAIYSSLRLLEIYSHDI